MLRRFDLAMGGLAAVSSIIGGPLLAQDQAAAVVRAQPGFSSTPVRKEVDPAEKSERFLLLTPAGPLILEVEIALDGEPLYAPRERLIGELLKEADVDGDGKPSWMEALNKPGFVLSRLTPRAINLDERQRAAMIAQLTSTYDLDKDGLLSRYEVRNGLAQLYGGPSLSLNGVVGFRVIGQNLPSPAATFDRLDVDRDRLLSATELAAAPERLLGADLDGNELLLRPELGGILPDPSLQVLRAVGGNAASQDLVLLGPAANSQTVAEAIMKKYGSGDKIDVDRFSWLSELAVALDANRDGAIEVSEAAGIVQQPPHVTLALAFGKKAAEQETLHVKQLTPFFGNLETAQRLDRDRLNLGLRGLNLELAVPASRFAVVNLESNVSSIMTRYDTDKNGYLEKQELGEQPALMTQFAQWDRDQDGKVFASEIKESMEREQAPAMSGVSVSLGAPQDALFSLLDSNRDERLGLREMRSAAARLATLDTDKDGKLASGEIPFRLSLEFSRGNPSGRPGLVAFAAGTGGTPPNRPTAMPGTPDWFIKMDRNADGDISPREFLGTEQQFQRLDHDHDGLIDALESLTARLPD